MIRNKPSNTVVPWTHRWARSTLFLLALALLLAVAAGPGYAQSASPCGPHPSAACLTQALGTLNARYQAASGSAQAPLLTELLTLAAIRQQVLVGLVESDPGAVLQQALPANQRQSLPPAVQALVEAAVELEGTLEVLHEDRDTGSRYLHFLETGYPLKAGQFGVGHVPCGAEFRQGFSHLSEDRPTWDFGPKAC